MKVRSDLFTGVVPFVRTAEERSFSRAAEGLGVTTAAVSKAVRKLEDDLGVRLLERSSRTVALTPEGEDFLERARQAVLGIQGAREAMSAARREPHGEVSVTLPLVLGPFVVPHLTRLAAQYPKLTFRIDVSDRIARLPGESYDVAIRMGELDTSSLIARLVRRTRWVTVASPSYLARRAAPARPGELAAHNCLRFVAPNGKPRQWSFADAGRTVPTEVTGNLVVDHGDSLLVAAEAGMGICQVLDFMVEAKLRDGRLVELLGDFAAEGPSIHAVSTPARARSANVRAFTAALAESLRA